MLTYSATLLVMLISGLMFSFSSRKLDQRQAVKLAEDFVRRNGYTSAPVDTSEYKLAYELNDQFSNDIGMLIRNRHNKLYPKAFCVSHNEHGWHMDFYIPLWSWIN